MLLHVILSICAGLILSFLVVIPINTLKEFEPTLRDPNYIINQKDRGLTILDRNNRPFFYFYEAKSKKIVQSNNIPKHVIAAAIAAEDKDFYKHFGFSVKGIARSAYINIVKKEITQGGSTISQQVIKNTLLYPQKDFLRKYKELVLAIELERLYTKDQILEMYLNSAYFGEGAFGIEEAARTYFNKGASELSLAESSLLIGLLPSPSALSPLSNAPHLALARQNYVLQSMVNVGYISPNQKEAAQKKILAYNPEQLARSNEAPHFAIMVRNQLIAMMGEAKVARSGLKVKTSLDLDWQKKTEELLKQHVANLKIQRVTNGAAVIIDPTTHEIRAMAGSVDWFEPTFGKVNMALSPRQPGSAFKAIVYGAALESGAITPTTVLQDIPTTFGKNYRPQNYDRRFRGPIFVRRALANSLNIPAVSVLQKTGVRTMAAFAERMGITTLKDKQDYNLALALGANEVSLMEMTNAYATYANQGIFLPPISVLEITDKNGNPVDFKKPTETQAVSPETAYIISSMLSDNKARAETFGKALTISEPAAVKTGTSQNYRDSLTIGFTPSLAVGVWLGNNDNSPMTSISGSMGAAPLWRSLMETHLKETSRLTFVPPATVEKSPVCIGSNTFEYVKAGSIQEKRFCKPRPIETVPVDEQKRIAEQAQALSTSEAN